MFTNPNVRPPQGTDVVNITASNGDILTYKWTDLFKATLQNMTTSVTITAQTSQTITHNLGYDPKILVKDSSGNASWCSITFVSGVSFTLDFGTNSFTGTVSYL